MNPKIPSAPPRRRLHPAVKALVAIAAIAVIGVLFVRSVRDVRAEPYAISRAHLSGWTLGVDAAADADGAAVLLRPPPELPMNLFRQLFARQMESLGTPAQPGIALALRGELGAGLSAGDVVMLAREAGLEGASPTPRCVAYRRISDPGNTRQLYFLWFDLPGYDAFRQALSSRAAADYDPARLSPVMLMAAEPDFRRWHPVRVDEARDCVAPVDVY